MGPRESREGALGLRPLGFLRVVETASCRGVGALEAPGRTRWGAVDRGWAGDGDPLRTRAA